MLFLPLEEDSLFFRLCLYYGLLVLVLELAVPLLFQRRVRIELPHLALHVPVTPLSTHEFKQRRQALLQQAAALQQELAATPRRSPQKRRQVLSAGSSKNRLAISPSPSPCPSPTSSVEEVTMMQSPEETKGARQRREEQARAEESRVKRRRAMEVAASPTGQVPTSTRPSPTSDTHIPRPYNLPIGVLRGEEEVKEKHQYPQQEVDWEQVVSSTKARRTELPTLSSRSPLPSLNADIKGTGYTGTSEAALRLEALIASRRRRKASSPQIQMPIPPRATAASPVQNAALHVSSVAQKQQQSPLPLEHIDECVEMEEKKEQEEAVELSGKQSDFAAFCATFATGGAAAARHITEKRKHHEAFETDEEQPRVKTPRIVRRISFSDEVEALAASPAKDPPNPQSNGKRKHQQAFGMVEEVEDDDDAEWRSSLAFRPHRLG